MNYKLQLTYTFLAVLVCKLSISQPNNSQAGWGNLNYAAPESPAFKILDVSPSDIMRPSSVRNIALSVGNYYLNSGMSIPKNIALEVSPSLFNPKVSINTYKQNRWWYTSGISLGTKQNDNGSYAVAFGFKLRIIDKTDLRTDDDFGKFIRVAGTAGTEAFNDAIDEYNIEHHISVSASAETSDAYNNENPSPNPKHDEVAAYIDERINRRRIPSISEYREKRKKELWNKEILELGVASLINSKDSLIQNLSGPALVKFWLTNGSPLFGTKGQLLIGINGQLKDSSSQRADFFNIGTRLYYGGNDTKGFIDSEVKFQSFMPPVYSANIGIETTFFGGVWVNLSLGFKKIGGDKAVFTPGINFSFASEERR